MRYRRTTKQITDLATKILLTTDWNGYDTKIQLRGSFRTMFASDVLRLTAKIHTIRRYGNDNHKSFSFNKLINLLEDN